MWKAWLDMSGPEKNKNMSFELTVSKLENSIAWRESLGSIWDFKLMFICSVQHRYVLQKNIIECNLHIELAVLELIEVFTLLHI